MADTSILDGLIAAKTASESRDQSGPTSTLDALVPTGETQAPGKGTLPNWAIYDSGQPPQQAPPGAPGGPKK